jgi:deazaflavin-dependent oxidoreductase (nitroreductase family)
MADAMTEFNQKVIEEFRANGGKVGGAFAGAPMIIVTHTGAKSGKAHTTPLVYSMDGDRFVIIASKAGAPTNPAWYHNLIAHPEVTVEVGAERFPARAVEARGAERDRLFDAQARLMPQFNEYKKNTTRTIPVFTLERVR